MPGRVSIAHLRLTSISGEPVELPAGLVAVEKYKGLTLPVFYCALIPLPDQMHGADYGLSGESIIFGKKRSIAERFGSELLDKVRSHLWW